MTTFPTPAVAWAGSREANTPLVVLLHGRGSNEHDIITLADGLPVSVTYAAVRAPISEGGGYAWFANRGIGRPVAESLAETMAWFVTWLDDVAPVGRPVVLVRSPAMEEHDQRTVGSRVSSPFDGGSGERGHNRAPSVSGAMRPAVRTPVQRCTSPARSRWSMGAAFSYGPHSSRGSIHMSSNSLPSGSAP